MKNFFGYIFILFFIFISLGISNVYTLEQNRNILLEKISNSKTIISESINGYKYINTIDELSIGIKEINDIEKIKRINLKIEDYIKTFLNKTDLKSKKIVLILSYLNYKIDLIEYELIEKNNINYKYVSPYLEEIDLPDCDIINPEVQIITKKEDWLHINDIDKRIFCVSAGDYSDIGSIELKTSGTENKKRYIVLNNGNNLHPGKLTKTDLAKVSFVLQDTNYWVIDRMSYWESITTFRPIVMKNSDYNIINRYFMDNVGNGIILYPNSDNNTIQNSYIIRTDINIFNDRAAIGLFDNNESNISIKNTKIINNEIKNFVDGFQAIRMSTKNLNYEGTIVDNNLIYIDDTIYTDCKGNHDIKGQCAYAENAIDLKAGSNNPNNPIIISNNIMWGFRSSDKTNSYLDDPGAAIVAHHNVKNIIINTNIIFNSDYGININTPISDNFSIFNSDISNNIFSNIKNYSLGLVRASDINIVNNLIVSSKNIKDIQYGIYWILIINSNNIKFEFNKVFNNDNNIPLLLDVKNILINKNEYYMSETSNMNSVSDFFHEVNPLKNYKNFLVKTIEGNEIIIKNIIYKE